MYDYYLGGDHHLAVDRRAAEAAIRGFRQPWNKNHREALWRGRAFHAAHSAACPCRPTLHSRIAIPETHSGLSLVTEQVWSLRLARL